MRDRVDLSIVGPKWAIMGPDELLGHRVRVRGAFQRRKDNDLPNIFIYSLPHLFTHLSKLS